VISDENRRDFEQRRLRNVRLQVVNANFAPDKHREAEEWIDEQENALVREQIAIARSAVRRSTIALVISGVAALFAGVAALAAIVPLVIQHWR
jgi:CHASE3 domain sensor protein